MYCPEITPQALSQSVIAVPPLARDDDYRLNRDGNRKILAHLSQGGVRTVLYGGNANLYNMAVSEFGELLDLLEDVAPSDTWIIPSVGPDFGKAMDQIAILRDRDFPTAMLLPLVFPATSSGVATGLRRLAERYGRPMTAYIKSQDYITPADLAALVADGVVCSVKYANVRKDPDDDPYLAELVANIDTGRVVSGIGERPAISHLNGFGLNGFTSGSVCIAPALSTALLAALKAGRLEAAAALRANFLPLEDLRDNHSPLRVLHAAVATAEIAETGPLLPFLNNLVAPGLLAEIGAASRTLLAADAAHMAATA
ncbi:MAG: Dihydropicolinate synthase [Devosia sp.]|nr:Dihydropicolinate synthase [Devosia sp.]